MSASAKPRRPGLIERLKRSLGRAAVRKPPASGPTRDVIDGLPVMVCVVGRDLRYEFVNKTHARLHRSTPDDLEGLSLSDALADAVFDIIRPEMERALAGETVRFDSAFPSPDGGDGLVYESVYSPRVEDDVVTGFISHSINVSKRRRAEQDRRDLEVRMLSAQKLEGLGVLARGVAHDFNNLLGSMLGHADLAKGALARGGAVGEELDHVRTAALRAAELCKQLLVYAGESGREVRPVDVAKLTEEMAELLAVSIHPDVTLDFDFEDAASVVDGNPTQLRQLVMSG